MVNFQSSVEADIEQISGWISQDSSKAEGLPASYWLTGASCIFACRVDDEEGPVLYLRAEQEGTNVRFHTLFMPEDATSRRRVALVLLEGFPRFKDLMGAYGDALVMETKSEHLAAFMADKFGFSSVEGTDDYKLEFAPTSAGEESCQASGTLAENEAHILSECIVGENSTL